MRRVLIVTYYWPPTGGSGVQRWVKFAKLLPAQGWQPVIYTPENPERPALDTSLEAEIPAEAEILRTKIREPYAIYHRFAGKKAEGTGAGLNPINFQKKSLKQRLMLWIRSNLFVPDPRKSWVKPSVKYLTKYLREHPVDVIVTTGPPHSMHLIGLGLHSRTGIPWVADFRDPWTKMFYFKHLGLGRRALRKHQALEKAVLDNANAVISVSPLVQEDFVQMTSTPVHLITNGYDADDFAAPLPKRNDRAFRIVHTGLFASDGNPLKLWSALAAKCTEDLDFDHRLHIILAGKVDDEIVSAVREAGLGHKLELPGYLPHDRSVEALRSADLILLPLRQDPEYRKVLPGKIFECIAAGKPVLGIGQPDGAAARVLDETGTGRMFGWDDQAGIATFIDSVYEKSFSAAGKGVENYSREATTRKLVELLNNL
ncbi:MAG: glycosyltransferase family 4 protein [Bacteroidales bacterium]|nr:glycosyltransferase family 4 protein [Bacteroidales bacterium]